MMRVASSHNQEGNHQMRDPKNVEYVDRIIRLPELLAMIASSRSTVYEKINEKSRRYDPSFPRPIRLSCSARSAIGWRLSEVQLWIATR
ncbi:helix-turn-helix transcriptional regulator [Aeromonas salmonicida]|uniref:helix-turn-helix transcriptional regulator n=2 Tax=Aeromonas salmonicida TaxID=645 RepID=UPI0035A58A3E